MIFKRRVLATEGTEVTERRRRGAEWEVRSRSENGVRSLFSKRVGWN